MQDSELMQIWKSYDQKLEESLALNKKNALEITQIKIQSLIASMKPLKLIAIIIGIIWVVFVDVIIVNVFPFANPFFLVSAILQVLLTKLAIGIYLYQLVVIGQVDISEPVINTQEKIAGLISSTLWVARMLFLQLPVWTTFYWNKLMLINGNLFLYLIQLVVTISFTLAAVWLFLNIRYENRHKKWFRYIFNGKEWNPVIKSMEMLEQLHEPDKQ